LSIPQALNSGQYLSLLSELFTGLIKKVGITPRYVKEDAEGCEQWSHMRETRDVPCSQTRAIKRVCRIVYIPTVCLSTLIQT